MKEPLDSLDPVDWLVWADWIEDGLGEPSSEEDLGEDGSRSRAIARGLEETKGVLWIAARPG